MFPTIPDKTYFKIGEAADLIDVKPYIIRYWESEFRALKPAKTKSQQRLFRRRDIELLLVIRTLLYEHKFTTEGARQKLKELSDAGKSASEILDALALGEIPSAHVAAPAPTPSTDAEAIGPLREELQSVRDKLALQKRKLDDVAELLRSERASAQAAIRALEGSLGDVRAQLAERDAELAALRAVAGSGGAQVRDIGLEGLARIAARLRSSRESG